LKDAKRRKFDLVTLLAIDRLGRSTATVATTMDELAEAGVGMFTFKESMDSNTAHGRAMLEMAAVFARLEREMIWSASWRALGGPWLRASGSAVLPHRQ
jgi:site-specific DNA recombinase